MGSMISHFLKRWRHADTGAAQAEDYSPAPGTAIRYSPSLVGELKSDHEQFFELHRSMVRLFHDGRIDEIPALLATFENLLTAHLLTEQVRLYAYMDAYFSADSRTREMLREYRTEMDRIGDSVRRMIKKYRSLASDPVLQKDFAQDIEEFRQVLDERMSREESTLYPLYMPVTK
jgi:hemerythrin-like domain-containing protein